MRNCSLLLLIIFGLALCSFASKKCKRNRRNRKTVSSIQVVDADANENVPIPNYGSLLPAELWCYLMDFVDAKTGGNMALACKAFNEVSKTSKALHLKRIQTWIKNGLDSEKQYDMIQRRLALDIGNEYLKIPSTLPYNYILTLKQNVMFTAIQRITTLKLPDFFFLNVFCGEKQFSDVKELILNISGNYDIDFQQIKSSFPNIDILRIDLKRSKSLTSPFSVAAADSVFSAIPELKKLVIQVGHNGAQFSTLTDLAEFLNLLKHPRVELKIDSRYILTDDAVHWAFEILNAELKDQENPLNMKERFFLTVGYSDKIQKVITDNAMQINSLYYIGEQTDSLDDIFSRIGKFTQMEKLYLNLSNLSTSKLTVSGLKHLVNLVDLNLTCSAPQCESLLQSLEIIFPNISRLRIETRIQFDSWFQSLLELTKLKKLRFCTSITRKWMFVLMKSISEGAFPKLQEIFMPSLVYEEKSTNRNFVSIYRQMVANRPWIKFDNSPITS